MTAEMMDYIEEENITEFADLMLYARHNRRLVCLFMYFCLDDRKIYNIKKKQATAKVQGYRKQNDD